MFGRYSLFDENDTASIIPQGRMNHIEHINDELNQNEKVTNLNIKYITLYFKLNYVLTLFLPSLLHKS